MENNPVNPNFIAGDDGELSLRPRRLKEFIGQPRLKDNLQIAIDAARLRSEPLDHLLFFGPPGLGKTTLSYVCANEMNAEVVSTSGPTLERPGDLASILTSLDTGTFLFIDEIHRLSRPVEEILYTAMEDFTLDLVIGKGPGARTVKIPISPFTLIGATTRAGMISSPLRDRFGIHHFLTFYGVDDLTTIVKRTADILSIPIDEEGALEISRRSRGTPRIANRLLRRARDYAQVKGDGIITREIADQQMIMLEIDNLGLDDFDRRYLGTIIKNYNGGPVGIETLAAALSEDRDTIEDMCEPYLLQLGFLNRTSRGRVVTRLGYEHLGMTYIEPPQQSLF